ncbi:MAG: superoxide dismutase [Nostoc sp. DedVER02]|uniref:superoxide dismutase n=1 Tax=unclassified Nostoc TaxID=2593658 RepID=UPI002AD1F32C|nr:MULTISPECIES: superoxide dismutase [unclassified Nostoc]MDZ7985535.1 superoxide dismutase [Nostoc sp. DedVER02]MDZ8112043.1 superoxide dismutase [Nostoc sp. DedVER01b]
MIKHWRKTIVFFFTTIVLTILIVSYKPVLIAEAESSTSILTAAKSFASVAYPNRSLSAFPATLPPLPYSNGSLTKAIDAETMKLHHDTHHASYVKNLNDALKQYPNLQKRSVEALIVDLNSVPENIRTKVRNNGGGHLNHTIFWQLMSPEGGGQPSGAIAQQINQTFGSFDAFKKQFNAAGTSRFGSGWVWLVRNPQNQLQIVTTANQDNPIMDGLYPIMGNDLWEHAYYLKYRNRRAEYLNNWWSIVNWPQVNRRYLSLPTGSVN